MGLYSFILTIQTEPTRNQGKNFAVGIFWQAVQPSTGDVIYDEFDDGPSYTELESHFEHISPEELLLPEYLTVQTENFIRDYVTRVQRFVGRPLFSDVLDFFSMCLAIEAPCYEHKQHP